MVHKGKTTSDITYNPEDGPEAYNNPVVHNRLTEYTAMTKKVHMPDYNPRTEDIDGDVLVRVGGDKGMDVTGLPTGQSTQAPLPLCLRWEQGA
jgi:hypothetical protein